MAPVIDALEGAGLEVRDVESLRALRNDTASMGGESRGQLNAVTRSRRAREDMAVSTWPGRRLDSPPTGSINQILAVKCDEHGRSGVQAPRTIAFANPNP